MDRISKKQAREATDIIFGFLLDASLNKKLVSIVMEREAIEIPPGLGDTIQRYALGDLTIKIEIGPTPSRKRKIQP